MKGELKVHRNVVVIDVTFSRSRTTKGLVFLRDFLQWSLDEGIGPVVSGRSGPLGFVYAYRAKDAKKVLAWLKEHGLE